MKSKQITFVTAKIALLAAALAHAEDDHVEFKASPAKRLESGWREHRVESDVQKGETQVFVRLPDQLKDGEQLKVLYLLPVEPRNEQRWGDALAEVNKLDLANKYNVICVYPTFSHLPWYADHPSDKHIRQETYFLKVVIPLIEREYPALAERDGRLLLGFSKSGWGAWSLLLRHADRFACAAAWDAPLMEAEPRRFGMGPIFGDEENFTHYQISRLLGERGKVLGDRPRLILTGYDAFRAHHRQTHARLQELAIPHIYRDGPQRRHHWESGWVGEAAGLMLSPPGD